MIEELYSLLTDALKKLDLTDTEIASILDMKFQDGSELFTPDNINFFYDVCGYLKYHRYDITYEYLKSISELYEWTDKIMFTEPNKLIEDLKLIELKKKQDKLLPTLSGLYKCRRCDSTNVFEDSVITRGDEAAFVRVTCVSCGYRVK